MVRIRIFSGLLDASNAVRNANTNGSQAAVNFDNVTVTSSSRFNTTGMTLIVPASSVPSLYWMHIAVDVPPFTTTKVMFSNASLGIFTNQTNTTVGVTMASNGVIKVQPGTTIKLITTSNSLATYWVAFRIDNLFCPLNCFSRCSHNSYVLNGSNYVRHGTGE